MYQLGIDFGTSFTKAAVYEVGTDNYYPVPLDTGAKRKDRSIPSVAYVSSNGQSIRIGDEAINSRKEPRVKFYHSFKPELDTIDKEILTHREIIVRTFFVY